MPCYHPKIRVENTSKWEKALDGHRYHPATIYTPSQFGELEKVKSNINYNYQIIPCGNCIGCRLEYSREWANRGYLESKLYDKNSNWFVTITYDDEHLQKKEEIQTSDGFTYYHDENNGTLVPGDLTQFIKNIRQIMKRDYNQDGIRFMACGEYGSEEYTERPHYHIIFFNLNLPLEDLYNPRILGSYNEKNVYYQSHIIERAWNKGISNVSNATWNTIAYTARYITKKINGELSEHAYAEKGQDKEFFRVSRKPGIGEGYFKEHWKEIYKNDEITIHNKKGVVKCKPPKYFDKLLEKEHPKLYKEIKEKRKKAQKDNQTILDETTSLDRLQQYCIDERSKLSHQQALVREFESGRQ